MTRVNIDYLKQTLDIFFEANRHETKSAVTDRRGSIQRINQAIYELESHLIKLKKEYDVNLRLDASIESSHIEESFKADSVTAFRAQDYEHDFLLFLAYNHEPEKELRHRIDDFLEAFREHLTWIDLVVTETSVTRAKTNIRFAVSALRKQGLLHNARADMDPTGLLPTLLGVVVLLYIKNRGGNAQVPITAYPFKAYHNRSSYNLNDDLVTATQDLNLKQTLLQFLHQVAKEHVDTQPTVNGLVSDIVQNESNRNTIDLNVAFYRYESKLARSGQYYYLLKPFIDALKTT